MRSSAFLRPRSVRSNLSVRPFVRRRGTSLVELLVVIVVFLIGILAVAQIFPGGFKILAGARARSLASTLATSESQRLAARPDLLPEAILPVRIDNSGTIVYVDRGANDYAPAVSGIDSTGAATDANGNIIRDSANQPVLWGRLAGPNTFRRVVGETHRIGVPRFLSPFPSATTNPPTPFGGLVTLQFGPVDPHSGGLSVYGRDMFRRTASIQAVAPLAIPPLNAIDVPREYEYILANANPQSQTDFPSGLLLPAPVPTAANPGPQPYLYSLSLAVYIVEGGVLSRREVELPGTFTVTDANDPNDRGYAFLPIVNIPGVVPAGATLVGVERDTVRLARAFRPVAAAANFSSDPYEYTVLNPLLGTLLFNPQGANRFEQRPGEARQPFAARVNYDVYDWRILHEDFRIPRERFDVGATSMAPSVRLAVSPLRTSSDVGPDGLQAGVVEGLANVNGQRYIPAVTQDVAQTHFVLLDLETGGIYLEGKNNRHLIDVNKSSGRVRFLPYNATGAATGWLLLPDGTEVEVPTANRAVRAYYVGKDEWAVQVLRSPARYTRFTPTPGTPRPVAGTFYLGASDTQGLLAGSPTRIYFPGSDLGRKVTIGRISYLAGGVRRTYEGGDFVLRIIKGDPLNLPALDIRDVADDATGFDAAYDAPASNVRGASVVVRVFHNDAKFPLNPSGILDLSLTSNPFDRYLRQWRVDTKETFLDGGEPLQ